MSLFRNPPETMYADTGEGYVGYQVFGDGPRDIFFVTQMITNVDVMWDSPQIAAYFDRLSTCGRVVVAEYRGIGISDPFPVAMNPTFDDMLVDGIAVMDAAGMTNATLLGDTDAGPFSILLTASYPERIDGLILVNGYARLLRDDDYPIGIPDDAADRVSEWVKTMWGSQGFFALTAPASAGDERLSTWLARYQRLVTSPLAAGRMFDWYRTVDVRSVLGSINVPTLVIAHADGAYHRPEFSRYLAEQIPNAKLVELPGADTAPYFLADPEAVLDEVEEFLTGERAERVIDRTVATVMFTDIVDSTGHAASLGDQRWMEVLDEHKRLTSEYIRKFKGREVSTTGDGVVATFSGPTRAVTCAIQLSEAMPSLGLEIRVGLHTGEIELLEDGDIGGLAVHIAARVLAEVKGPDVVVSSTVKDLVAGSGIEFKELGARLLKGVPGEWSLFQLSVLPSAFRLSI